MESERAAARPGPGTPAGPETGHPGAAASLSRGAAAGQLLRRSARWETGLLVVVIAIAVFGVSTSSEFLTGSNIFNLGLGSGEIAIMALPMTLIIISGEIDLSVASILGMSSALLGVLWSKGWPMLAIFAVLVLLGIAASSTGCW